MATTALILLAATAPVSRACDAGVELVITEFMALNTSTHADENNEYSDWIELHNPCLPSVDVGGWYLTDSASNLTRWQFPSVTLQRGDFLVVFASGKDRAIAGSELHTNFSLDSDGEFLALVKPNGVTIAQSFSPYFPPQQPDVSYGMPQAMYDPVSFGDTMSYLVPTVADAALGLAWTATTFDDNAWDSGPSGLGFATGSSPGFEVSFYRANISVSSLATAEAVLADPLTQTSVVTVNAPVVNYLNTGGAGHFGSDSPFPGTSIGSDVNDFVTLVTGTILIPTAGPWTFGVNSDDGFGLELNREPHVFNSSYPGTRGASDTLATFDIPEPGSYAVRLVQFERGGGASLEFFAAEGQHTSFSSSFHLVGDVAGGGLGMADLGSLVGTNLQGSMQDVNASLWSRAEFDIADPALLSLLTLKISYEDGFVAYLNGGEVARRNAPFPTLWDSTALGDLPDEDAAAAESIDLSDYLYLLQPGPNVLAIHGLNDAVDNGSFLIAPELDAAEDTSTSDPLRYFPEPTPGNYNEAGFPGVSGNPTFSHPNSLFVDPFFLTITADDPGAVIRYTLDGSEPTDSHGTIYSAPLYIDTSVRIRARVLEPGLASGTVVTRLYTMLGADLLDFDSNLPLVVLNTFGNGLNTTWFTEILSSVIPTSGGRASITDPPEFMGYAGLKLRGSSSLGFPKKQYLMEVWDEYRDDLDVGFLGLPAESDWILNGPYSDKALMRNALAYKWSNDAGRYAVRTRFVETYLRTSSGPVTASNYAGLYVLMEKIKRNPARVPITRILPTDSVAPEVTGGYIIKKDRLDPGDSGFRTVRGQTLAYVEPKENQITAAQATYLKGYLDEFETVLYGAGFTDPVTGYAAYADVDTFIDHHILVELTKNIDGYRLSTFFFKDRGGKLQAGPIWDYNLCLGNANYLQGWLSEGWYYELISSGNYPWWPRMFEDEEFQLRYADRWHELRRDQFRTENLLGDIDTFAAQIDEAQQRNFVRWPVLGTYVWPNWFIADTYAEEIDWMKQWLADRLVWMDGQLSPPPVYNHPGGLIPTNFGLTISAATGMIYYTLDGSDPREPGGAISASAMLYSSPLALSAPTRVIARSLDGSTWSASNEADFEPIPLAYLNEILPSNVSVLSDEQGEFDPWIELYNAFPDSIDLGGLYLTDVQGDPFKWPLPLATRLCAGQWLIVWADGETADGPLHTNFALNPAGGTVWLFDQTGFLVDSVTYPALPGNVSLGRFPDGGASLREIRYPTPGQPNQGVTTPVFLNEYNAVAPGGFLENFDSDSYWGLTQGNGGDWFELVVVEDHLDLRGWQVVVDDQDGAVSTTLTLGTDPVLSDLRSGSIITIAEELASDVSYDPVLGDWWINLQAGSGGDGVYVSNLGFSVSNANTQITVLDDFAVVVYGPAGEGINPLSGIGNDEVFKLEEDPGPDVNPLSAYNDGSSSTFGAPNLWNGGASEQDFRPLRSVLSRICFADSDCYDANPCTDDSCVGYLCHNDDNTATCDDGNPCTDNDVCAYGQCHGDAIADCCYSDCDCDDGDPCSADLCTDNTCQFADAPTGTSCDDADLCTENDVCDLGICGGSALDCSLLNDACNAGVCNPGDGLCEPQPVNEGGACDDGDFCTTGETCGGGLCGSGGPVDCSAWDDDCNTGVCNPLDGSCESQAANEGATCDDGSLCTLGDTCVAGVCGAYVDCSSLDDACNVGVCNPTSGDCEIQPLLDGTTCDDGDACTTGDACQVGVCTGGAPPDCDDANVCTDDSCDSATGCVNDPVIDGTSCDDGDLCTESDQCATGVCAGSSLDCSGLDDQCNSGVCDPATGVCQAEPLIDGTTCDDGVPCTETDLCTAGVCGGTAVDCSSLDDSCNAGVCNVISGACEAQPLIDGTTCDDGNLCTELDQCTTGACAGSALDCSGLDGQCTLGVCNSLSGVCEAEPANEGLACDDGDLCTVGATCSAGGCGVVVDCSAFADQCNDGVCNPGTGACEAQPLTDGLACEDGNACTIADSCQTGACVAGPAPDCDDLNECTGDSCDPGTGCVNAPVTDGTSCDDGALCTENDNCVAGVCTGPAVDCSAQSGDCTLGVCNAGTGSCEAWPVPEGTLCEDGEACTTQDSCRVGVCTGGPPPDCDDGNVCTADGCLDGACVYSSSGACSISGDMHYYRGAVSEPSTKPVPDVEIDASLDGSPEAMTDATGFFQIAGQSGTLTVTTLPKFGVSRAADHNGAISSFDAAFVAQFAVQQIALSPNQQIAGDVSNNGSVSSFDAALVAQFAAQLVDHFPVADQLGSDWAFARCDNYTGAFDHDCGDPLYVHDPLTQTETDDFFAILYGDVTGNWEAQGGKSGTAEMKAAEEDQRRGDRLRARAAGVRRQRTRETPATLSLDGWSGGLAAGEQRELVLTLRQADGIEALDLRLGYDPDRIAIVEVRPVGIGAEFSAATHDLRGTHNVAMFGLLPMEGSGSVLAITIEALRDIGPRPAVTVSGEANENGIPLVFDVQPQRAAPRRGPARRAN